MPVERRGWVIAFELFPANWGIKPEPLFHVRFLRMPTLVGFPRACGGRQPCAVMQSLTLGPQVAFLEAADPAANRQGVSQIQASRGYQSSMRRVLQLSTAGGGHFEAAFISEIAAGRQRATTGHLENYGIFGAAPTSSHSD